MEKTPETPPREEGFEEKFKKIKEQMFDLFQVEIQAVGLEGKVNKPTGFIIFVAKETTEESIERIIKTFKDLLPTRYQELPVTVEKAKFATLQGAR